MPRDYGLKDQYVPAHILARVNFALQRFKYSITEVAFDMRMDRSHISRMLSGRANMAHHHLLAIKYLLLAKKAESKETLPKEVS